MHNAAILLGASAFIDDYFHGGRYLSTSYTIFRSYLIDSSLVLDDDRYLLDLFNSDLSAIDIQARIVTFLQSHSGLIEPGDKEDMRNLFVYYVGHGYFSEDNSSYYWALKSTDPDNPFGSGFDVSVLGSILRKWATGFRVFGIVDCCFAGASATLLGRDTFGVVAHNELNRSFQLPKGRAVLCSSSRDAASNVSSDNSATLFTKALVSVLRDPQKSTAKRLLSFVDLATLTKSWMYQHDGHRAVSPEIHGPDQSAGFLASEAVFPVIGKPATTQVNDHRETEEIAEMHEDLATEHANLNDREKLEVLEFLQVAASTLPSVISALHVCGVNRVSYAVTSRIKDSFSVYRKILSRRHNGNQDYSLSDVTDIIGIRVTCLFKEEILEVIDAVCDLVSNNAPISPNPFEGGNVLEAKVYSSEGPGDISQIAQRSETRINEKLAHILVNKCKVRTRQDYSSIHIVATARDMAHPGGRSEVPVEIQIRSIFEDAWAQIDHRLRYSETRQKNKGQRVNVSANSEVQLKLLKQMLDTTAAFADSILRTSKSSPKAQTTLTTIDGTSHFVRCAEAFGIPSEYADAFLNLLKQKTDIDEKMETLDKSAPNYEESIRMMVNGYQLVAEDMHEFYEKETRSGGYFTEDSLSKDAAAKALFYFVRMEEALARALSKDAGEISIAAAIYKELGGYFPDYPTVHLRIGQTANQLDEHEQSVSAFKKCRELTDKIRHLPENERLLLLSNGQLEYIDKNLYRLQGFSLWRMGDALRGRNGEKATYISLFLQAYNLSRSGIAVFQKYAQDDLTLLRLLNNTLFYAVDYLDSCRRLDITPSDEVNDSIIKQLLSELMGHSKFDSEKEASIYDTVSRAYELTGDIENAVSFATAAMDLVQAHTSISLTEFQREGHDRITKRFWRFFRDGLVKRLD